MRRTALRAATLVACTGLIVIAGPAAEGIARTHDPIVRANQVGPLTLNVSGPHAVFNFAGFPQAGNPHALAYDCHRTSHRQVVCRINYLFGSSGRYKNRLIAVLLAAGPFRTRNGTRIGMSAAAARRRERGAVASTLCGQPVLRRPPPGGSSGAPYAGLNIAFRAGKVLSFVVFSTHARVACLPGGLFFVS